MSQENYKAQTAILREALMQIHSLEWDSVIVARTYAQVQRIAMEALVAAKYATSPPLPPSPPLPADSVVVREQVAAGDALRISMSDVPENILGWASYASEHFQEKYGMQDDADRYKKALSAYDAAISKGETQ